jgi:hypothetical protein
MAALHLCFALAVAQTTGLVHVLTDVASVAAGVQDHDECPDERDGRHCPPGCPTCHCSHAVSALPPLAMAAFVDAFDPVTTVARTPTAAAATIPPVLPGIYRPPRPTPTDA